MIANGKLYSLAYDGYVHAYDMNTGQEVWKFASGSAGRETPYGTYPFYYGPIIADGVCFVGTGEHSPTQPLIRGEKLFAINDQTGDEIWSLTGFHVLQAIADGYLISYNGEDNRIYCFGKGKTQLAPPAPTPTPPPPSARGSGCRARPRAERSTGSPARAGGS